MVKFAAVTPGSVVQLGRFNKTRKELSNSLGVVTEKRTLKIGTSTFSAIFVEVAPNRVEEVALPNIRAVL